MIWLEKETLQKAINLKIEENFELFDKEILIVGFGRIGRKLIKRCLGFDCKVKVYDPFVDKKTINSHGGTKVNDLKGGFKTLRYIIIKSSIK